MSDLDPATQLTDSVPEELPAGYPPRGYRAPRSGTERPREGLPPSYRMRADSHYVDQLGGAQDQKGGAMTVPTSSDAGLARLHHALAEHLATIQGAAALLGGDPANLAHDVGLDLIRVQSARALWLLQASELIAGRRESRRRARRLGPMLTGLADRLAAECRLSRIGLDVRASDWQATVEVDEQALLVGVTGAILATAGLVGPSDGSVIRIAAAAGPDGTLTIDVVQEEIGLADETRLRFFDGAWADRPGGWIASLGANAARAATERADGSAVIESTGRRGSTIRLTFGRS